ncbi:hypothetical protein [Vibrio sp. ABG19]|uniref:hypothetical protein n=1 Tax=Vibrio sp. ABG19 TaxID=2817385 RepID=UPI00249E1E4F|nr:hypothetical protein [Vibrio sp. ABG19]WGY45232.1 hypothetical protein J0X00_05930 [Vibrio sp. ABG19]
MTIRQSASFNNTVYVGAHGNLSLEEGRVVAVAAAIGDEFQVLELPIGLKLTGVRLITAGLGNAVAIDVKVNDTVLVADEAVADAVSKHIPIAPEYLAEKGVLSVTIKGGEATGSLIVMPEYVNVGF